MKLGIVGLPNVGKSTLFNAITNAGAESANYPFCTIDPNVGVVAVPDHRLDALTEMYHPKKTTPAVVEFVDIAGLVKGASKGQGLGNKFLANIRECDAIVHVVRCFDDENIMHVVADTSTNVPVDPAGDIGVIDIELIMADVEMVERRIDKAQKAAKGDKKYLREVRACGTGSTTATPPAPSTVTRTTPPSSPPPSCSPSSPSSTPPTWMRRALPTATPTPTTRWWRSWPPRRGPRSSPSVPSWRRRSPSWTARRRRCSWTIWE